MKIKCKVCRREIEVNEADYNPGEKITVECERCGTETEVTIPEYEEAPSKKQSEKTPVISEGNPDRNEEEIRESASSDDQTENGYEASYREEDDGEEYLSVSNAVPQSVDGKKQYEGHSSAELFASLMHESTKSTQTTTESGKSKENSGCSWLILVLLLLVACGAGGWWYYENVYMPEKIDREAPRTYPIVNLNLRSSKMAGSDFNKIMSVPYGSELITYDRDEEWAEVKYVKPDGSESTTGYVASPYLLDKRDFFILNSMFGDNDARKILATAKVRRALLDYYKDNGYVGNLSSELMESVGLTADSSRQWQVFFPQGEKKPNEVVFKRLVNAKSKFTDMALIIKNINTGERKLLYFYFDDDETSHFVGEMAAPREGNLKDVTMSGGTIIPTFVN